MPRFAMETGWDTAILTVPEHLRHGLLRYLASGLQPGRFLCAVIENDLFAAATSAGPGSLEGLPYLMRFLHNYCPSACWGSKDKRLAWRGLEKAA